MKVVKVIGDLSFEIEGETQRDVFKQIASFEEVFGTNTCGKCQSTDTRHVVRDVDGNEFYEVRCQSCGAKLAFGSTKKGGGLFPKRKDNDGNWLPDGGWVKWNPKTKTAE